MILSKYERKKQELIDRQKKELAELEEQEKRERERLVKPVIDKMTKVATEEAQKLLDKQPDLLENYSFKKRDAARAIREALEKVFAEGQGEARQEPSKNPSAQPVTAAQNPPSEPDDVFDAT